jgi:sirohydrochlorin cobaltochelatase
LKGEEKAMKKNYLIVGLTVALVFTLTGLASAGAHPKARPVKKGILLVAFGTSVPQARQAFTHIEQRVKERFPGVPVRWAYTSHIIRKKLAKQGESLDSEAAALAKMMDEGFTHVAVQSLHTIRGEEYTDLVHTTHAFGVMPEGIEQILVGEPLLSSQTDLERTAAAILENIPVERKANEAVVLMGHGSPHPANAFYTALMFHLQRKDPLVFLGTVEGVPLIEDILVELRKKKIRKAFLMPFMSVAGDHARNDMAGPEKDSWKSILEKNGIACETILKGTAEFDNMVDIWVDHLAVLMEHFK